MKFLSSLCFLSLSVLLFMLNGAMGENKYSANANTKSDTDFNFRTLNKPFRMSKLNTLWTKAQVRLSEPKLKSLFSDLKIQDKEEIGYKRFKNEGMDKEGTKEAELRRKLLNIMSAYDLLEHFEDVSTKMKMADDKFNIVSDEHINKSLFKDKKLNKLWMKAEMGGFTIEELQALKEEFSHHQEKIDEYYSLLNDTDISNNDNIENALNEEEMDRYNEIDGKFYENENAAIVRASLIRERHLDLKDGYDKLHRKASKGPLSEDFLEPKVQQLWSIALKADFKAHELESLKIELLHYEAKINKLRKLQAEKAANKFNKVESNEIKPIIQLSDDIDDTIKKQMRKIEKTHFDLERRIFERHTEL